MPALAEYFVEWPRVEVLGERQFAFARLEPGYAALLENFALAEEEAIKTLPVAERWEHKEQTNPTTSRYNSYNVFLLSPQTLPLYFAIKQTYLRLLQAAGLEPGSRFIQCWYNIHRAGQCLPRHKHPYPFIGTFSAHATGSVTRYGSARHTSNSDVILHHAPGQLMVTTGRDHFHETSVWQDSARPRVTFAFDILDESQWAPGQVFVPFDVVLSAAPAEAPA
jgi:hypothetical protein